MSYKMAIKVNLFRQAVVHTNCPHVVGEAVDFIFKIIVIVALPQNVLLAGNGRRGVERYCGKSTTLLKSVKIVVSFNLHNHVHDK